MEKYFGAEAKVRQLNTTSVDGTVLTLNFTDATSIDVGKPYLVKPAATVDFSADGKEFAGVNLTAASATPTATTYVDFIPTLGKTAVDGNVKDILILNTSGTLVHRSATGNMKGSPFGRICRSTCGRLLPKGRKNPTAANISICNAEKHGEADSEILILTAAGFPLDLWSLATEGTQEIRLNAR